MRLLTLAGAVCIVAMAAHANAPAPVAEALISGKTLPRNLSDFNFFTDSAGRIPNTGVHSYRLNSPLFSDYAEKYRFIYMPEGRKAIAASSGALIEFPVGTALIKSFGYGQGEKLRLLETRILLRRVDGWIALPYVWNEEQTGATLKVAGKRIPVTFTDPSGNQQTISYAVPNKNQCKECHSLSDTVQPIGPRLRNMTPESANRLNEAGILKIAKTDNMMMPDYADEAAPFDQRARAYLDVNCAHCHNDRGSASNSGLFLGYEIHDPIRIGINKRPIAAGRGSGGHEFSIAPGKPEDSIMIYRLKSLDPGIAMPEVGRSTVHKEGVALLSEWIAVLDS